MSDKQVKDYDKFNVRFPDGMRDAIADRAKRNGRSMNAEIVQILQDALDAGNKSVLSVAGVDVQEIHRILDRVIEESLGNIK
ncbi:Arc family DNA-binding protein [Salmonella enterica subsp. enterica]|nr:Arc family DNA-binding protein [Salmonella enterica]ECC3110461.1 Arc family DNA-binding protein [Salmonella enterica subsp. enterica]EAX6330723.1 Arc family DNA-binding protein [Salmonella enterica]EBQ2834117.1 Arc family DNA-binding protein [Salmonella enterica]EDU9526522.1 Arc family DNA-binding protein [Salmonella enterica subsp. enterica]